MVLIIFDIDGTLTDTKGIDDFLYRSALKEIFSLEFADEDWEDVKIQSTGTDSGILHDVFFKQFKRKPGAHLIEKFKDYFFHLLRSHFQDIPENFKEIPGALSIIHHLMKAPDYLVGFATGSWSESAKIKLGSIGIHPRHVPFGTSDICSKRSDIIRDVIKQATSLYEGMKLENIIYVGDGIWDYKAAKELDIGFIGVDSDNNGTLQGLGITKLVKDYSDIPKFLAMIDRH
jgi:phosphoglycolate phosphatase-like HAD superfamily hydrolase